MSTATLEQIDWRAVLDDSPMCGGDNCSRPATHRLRWACGCSYLVCGACLAEVGFRIALALIRAGSASIPFQHADCGTKWEARQVSDVMRVTQL